MDIHWELRIIINTYLELKVFSEKSERYLFNLSVQVHVLSVCVLCPLDEPKGLAHCRQTAGLKSCTVGTRSNDVSDPICSLCCYHTCFVNDIPGGLL